MTRGVGLNLAAILWLIGCTSTAEDASSGGSGGSGGSGAAGAGGSGQGGSGGAEGTGGFDPGPPVSYELAPIGAPTWTITDVNFVVCPGGFEIDYYSDSAAFTADILSSHELHTAPLLWATCEPHAGPYETEYSNGLAALDYDSVSRFRESDFEPPSGLCMWMMMVPSEGAPTGSSPAAEMGPIVDFGSSLTMDGTLRREGEVIDPVWDGEYPNPNGLAPPLQHAHWNHVPMWFLDNNDFSEHRPGNYEFDVSLLGSNGAGYRIVIPYEVVAD